MKDMRKVLIPIVSIVACLALALSLAGCGSSSEEETDEGSEAVGEVEETEEVEAVEEAEEEETLGETTATTWQGTVGLEDDIVVSAAQEYAGGSYVATVNVEGYGSFEIDLDEESAPISAANFCALAENGYYDGLALYRVVEGFCLQGGTLGNSASGSDDELVNITGEFSDNGVNNELADEFGYGTVAMARSDDMDSASSTFFITLGDNDSVGVSLDGLYAAFGTIDSEGMEVVEDIVAATADKIDDSGMGIIADEADMPIIESIEIEAE